MSDESERMKPKNIQYTFSPFPSAAQFPESSTNFHEDIESSGERVGPNPYIILKTQHL